MNQETKIAKAVRIMNLFPTAPIIAITESDAIISLLEHNTNINQAAICLILGLQKENEELRVEIEESQICGNPLSQEHKDAQRKLNIQRSTLIGKIIEKGEG